MTNVVIENRFRTWRIRIGSRREKNCFQGFRQPGVYNVHLPIMLESERQAVYRERKTKRDSNQSPQLQRLARNLKFRA